MGARPGPGPVAVRNYRVSVPGPRFARGGRVGYTGDMDEVFLLREVDKLCTRLALLRPHLEDFGSGPIVTVYRSLQAELDTVCEKLNKLWVA